MNIRLNQFTLKGGLAENSFGVNMELKDKRIFSEPGKGYSVFFSRPLDSWEYDMRWNELNLELSGLQGTTYNVRAIALNENSFLKDGQYVDAVKFLFDPQEDIKEKIKFFDKERGGILTVDNPRMLLYNLCGRYLYICIEFFYGIDDVPVIENICAEFPMENFIENMPEIYQQNYDFTSRFLAIPGMMATELNNEIDTFVQKLDLSLTEEENLYYLATWVGAEEKTGILPKNKVRDFLKKTVHFSSIKGTCRCLREVSEFLTDCPVRIVEYQNMERFSAGDRSKYEFLKKTIKDEDTFGVILPENCFANGITRGQLELFIKFYKPAASKFELLYEIRKKDGEGTYFASNLGSGDLKKAVLDSSGEAVLGDVVMES